MSEAALRHLSADPAFAALIDRVGPPRLVVEHHRSPYEALVRAIAHQQLHGRAAEAILARFAALYPGGAFLRIEDRRATRHRRPQPGRHRPDPARIGAHDR